jgi:hypothetical protein
MTPSFTHAWLPYIYQYGLGAVIFIIGLAITLRSGSFDLSRRLHRKWLGVLVVGFVWYLTLHGALTIAALGHERIALGGAAAVVALSAAGALLFIRRRGGP